MTQQVNLYQFIVPTRSAALSAGLIAKAAAAIVLLLVSVYAYEQLRARSDRLELSELQQRQEAYTQQIDAFSERATSQVEDRQLIASVEKLRGEVRARNRLLGSLSDHLLGNTVGFSPHLVGLARQRVAGLWLKEIRISGGGVKLALSGSSLDPTGVPDLIEKLGTESAFAGREFRSLRLEAAPEPGGVIEFSLSTEYESSS